MFPLIQPRAYIRGMIKRVERIGMCSGCVKGESR
jgi:hypothetical protein